MSALTVDLHSHVMPGVDDGAGDVEQGLAGLRALAAEGVGVVVATPHLDAALGADPAAIGDRLAEFDAAFGLLEAALAGSDLELRLERGAEVKLSVPDPDLSDPRVRLAGTDRVLVEFPGFSVPPFAERQLEDVRAAGRVPVLAHPERYLGIREALEGGRVERWKEGGVVFQLNAGSVVGKYGTEARRVARRMLERGWVDCFSSDFHCRGEPLVRAGRAEVLAATGQPEGSEEAKEAVRLLLEENPSRILAGQDTLPVPPLTLTGGVWGSLKGLFR